MPNKSQDLSGKYETHCTAFVNHTTSGILHYKLKGKVHSGQGCLSISAQPHNPLLLIYLILLSSLQDSYCKASSYWKILLEPMMFFTLPSSFKKKKKKEVIKFDCFKPFQQLTEPGGPFHHFTESIKNMHSLRPELCSHSSCLEDNSKSGVSPQLGPEWFHLSPVCCVLPADNEGNIYSS